MKNFILTIIGVATLLIALTLNFRHALDDYGVTKNKLHMEVLAQTNDTGGGGTSGGDSSGGDSSGGDSSGGGSTSGSLWGRVDSNCVYEFYGKANSTVTFNLFGVPISLTIGADGMASYTYKDGKTNCQQGGNQQCTARYCPPLL